MRKFINMLVVFKRGRRLRAVSSITIALALLSVSCNNRTFVTINRDSEVNPWTSLNFKNSPEEFQFAILADHTGAPRPEVLIDAVEKLNLLQPEFVMCIGDLIVGYTEDEDTIDNQWVSFDSIITRLEMPFFYLPGNHDISNYKMADKWARRFGRSYYHFVYKKVLFLCMNTQDSACSTITDIQVDYFKDVLESNNNVRWTYVFMHHPMWLYEEERGWGRISEILGHREYTVFSGHHHRYTKFVRNNRNLYILGTTGGGFPGPEGEACQFDHVVWVTMKNSGPRIANLLLESIKKDDVCAEEETVNLKGISREPEAVH